MNKVLNIVNENGTFSFDINSNFNTNSFNTTFNTKNLINLRSQNATFNFNESLIISSNSYNLNSNIIHFENKEFNIKSNVIFINSNNININGSELINIGINDEIESLTKIINIESLNEININSEDFNLVTSDSINLISQTGEIIFGSTIENPYIKFETDSILFNQNESTYNKQFNILVNKSSNKKDFNGILLNGEEVNNEIEIINKENSISLGTFKDFNRHSILDYFYGYKKGNKIYFENGVNILKHIYWIDTDVYDIIQESYYELTDIKTNSEDELKISIVKNNTIKYNILILESNEIKINNKIMKLEKIMTLENIEIEFDLDKIKINDCWDFKLGLVAISEKMNNIEYQKGYILNNNLSYLNYSNDFEINKSIQLSSNNGISINDTYPKPNTFSISNNLNKPVTITDYLNIKQQNPKLYTINKELIFLWEEVINHTTNIYFKKKNIITKINKNITTNNQLDISNLDDTNFIVIWVKSDFIEDKNKLYEIHYQIYKNNKPIKNFDILLTRLYNYKNIINPKVLCINDKHLLIVFCGEEDILYKLNIYGIIIDFNGNVIIDKFKINEDNDYNYIYPKLFLVKNKGYGCLYHYEDNHKYKLKYKLLNDKSSETIDLKFDYESKNNIIESKKLLDNNNLIFYPVLDIRLFIKANDIVYYNYFYYKIIKIENNILHLEETSIINNKNVKHIEFTILEKNDSQYKCTINNYYYRCEMKYNIFENKLKCLDIKINCKNDTNIIRKTDNYEVMNIKNGFNINYKKMNNFIEVLEDVKDYDICLLKDKNEYNRELIIFYESGTTLKFIKIDYENDMFKIKNRLNCNLSLTQNGELYIGSEKQNQKSTVNINGSISKPIKLVKDTIYLDKEYTILCDTSEKDIEIILPNRNIYGRIYKIKKLAIENKVIIKSNYTIDNNKNYEIEELNKCITIQFLDNKWFII